MKIKNIANYFSDEILRRGYDYYKKGNVINIHKLESIYSAKVKGTENYEVEINLELTPYKMDCSCPYAVDNNCKHMAAVLYCLKNEKIPIKEIKTINISKNITDFEKFQKEYRSEYYKLFNNRTYLNSNEEDDFVKLVLTFVDKGATCIKTNPHLAYEIFEYFILKVDNINATVSFDEYDYNCDYDEYYYENHDDTIELERKNLFEIIFKKFSPLLENNAIFPKILTFINKTYTTETDDFYFNNDTELLNLTYDAIDFKWQAEEMIKLLNKLYKNKNIYAYKDDDFTAKKIMLIHKFIDKNLAISKAEQNLEIDEMCDLLINEYRNNTEKIIEILKKIIIVKDGWQTKKYIEQLLEIYLMYDKDEYIKLLKDQFIKNGTIEMYNEIKNYYCPKDWNKLKNEYLQLVINNKPLYRNICLEEGYYNELLLSLEDSMIEYIGEYIKVLVKKKPTETLALYKKLILDNVEKASSRAAYQKILSYFGIMLNTMPNGKREVLDIIKYIRDNYKNRKAFQEELDFFEETYL